MSSLKCIFVGDLALGDHPKSVGFGLYSRYRDGIPASKAHSLIPSLHQHDILFGNLEFTLGNPGQLEGGPIELSCRGITAYAKFLQQAGFDILNVANNHIFQHGEGEFLKTLDVLSNQGIRIVGLRDQPIAPTVMEAGEYSIGFLAWSARPRQGFSEIPPYAEFDEQTCYEQISQARSRSSFVVVSMHWGEEFVEIPSPDERRIARRMIDAGAHVVVGHHPHVLREVEAYGGGLIAYSLGNFICDMTWNEATRRTGYLYVELSGEGVGRWEMVHGRIDDDYFPDFSGNPLPPKRAIAASGQPMDEVSYGVLARRALRRHQALTVLHMIRNCFRYSAAVWLRMLRGAVYERLT